MVSREAVRKLVELVDTAADISDAYIDTEEIKKTWQIKGFLNRIVSIQRSIVRLRQTHVVFDIFFISIV